ncbi:N-glycosylase/DNA lyase OGG1 [Aristolochia californica]|uniref:N-glycosylase/DNA lyase OGG1 n=1 Tax=Aristolochia californica TaxID=171875 RepID=UPI0035D7003A
MKRRRPMPSVPAASSPPPTPRNRTLPSSKTRKRFAQALASESPPSTWQPLTVGRRELFLPLTFPTGQTFTWKQTGATTFTGPVNSHLISLRHLPDDSVSFLIHCSSDHRRAVADLRDYLNLDISLAELWESFSSADSRFAAIAPYLGGARVLRQDPVECLFQFLCSSNNNIARITKMVGFLAALGNYLRTVDGFDFYEFPSLERLELVSEQELRNAGFGYRAKYIIGTVKALQSKPGGGAHWLASLRDLELPEVIEGLCTLPGVGPKVAACIALFSLDQHQAIPVDTHVWQIATRDLLPELAGARLTPTLCSRVAEAFVSKYGKFAGWAQTALFIGELPPQKTLLPSHLCHIKDIKSIRGKESVKKKVTTE